MGVTNIGQPCLGELLTLNGVAQVGVYSCHGEGCAHGRYPTKLVNVRLLLDFIN